MGKMNKSQLICNVVALLDKLTLAQLEMLLGIVNGFIKGGNDETLVNEDKTDNEKSGNEESAIKGALLTNEDFEKATPFKADEKKSLRCVGKIVLRAYCGINKRAKKAGGSKVMYEVVKGKRVKVKDADKRNAKNPENVREYWVFSSTKARDEFLKAQKDFCTYEYDGDKPVLKNGKKVKRETAYEMVVEPC